MGPPIDSRHACNYLTVKAAVQQVRDWAAVRVHDDQGDPPSPWTNDPTTWQSELVVYFPKRRPIGLFYLSC
jgi:hypothetical protein